MLCGRLPGRPCLSAFRPSFCTETCSLPLLLASFVDFSRSSLQDSLCGSAYTRASIIVDFHLSFHRRAAFNNAFAASFNAPLSYHQTTSTFTTLCIGAQRSPPIGVGSLPSSSSTAGERSSSAGLSLYNNAAVITLAACPAHQHKFRASGRIIIEYLYISLHRKFPFSASGLISSLLFRWR